MMMMMTMLMIAVMLLMTTTTTMSREYGVGVVKWPERRESERGKREGGWEGG